MASVKEFKNRFPEFCENEDPRVQLFLDDAALLMKGPERWLDFYEVAHAYHAAHLLALAELSETGDSGPVSPIKKQEVDDVVIESAIAPIQPTLEDYYSTTYGKQYIKYRRICFAGIVGA